MSPLRRLFSYTLRFKLSFFVSINAIFNLSAPGAAKLVNPFALSYKDEWFGGGMKYAKDFQNLYNYDPPYQSAESSAALLVYKDAFERANSFDTKKVRDALAATDMQTFYGNIKFAAGGQNVSKPMVLFQVSCNDDGSKCENKVVAPTKWASAELVHPIPSWSKR